MIQICSILLLLITFVGCASRGSSTEYSVAILGYSDPSAQRNKAFFLTHENQGYAESLEFKEYKKYASNLLVRNGFVEASSKAKSDVVIYLSFYMDDGKTVTETKSVPVFNQPQKVEFQNNYGQSIGSATVGDANPWMPSGYRQVSESYTLFTRVVRFNAFMRSTGAQIWDLRISSSGTSADLKKVYPQLLLAAEPYIAKSTSALINLTHTEDLAEADMLFSSATKRTPAQEEEKKIQDCTQLQKLIKHQGCY